jgi:hypothetical protein
MVLPSAKVTTSCAGSGRGLSEAKYESGGGRNQVEIPDNAKEEKHIQIIRLMEGI